jgi:hypothetical protein
VICLWWVVFFKEVNNLTYCDICGSWAVGNEVRKQEVQNEDGDVETTDICRECDDEQSRDPSLGERASA